jgi:hypothetical protein
VTTESKLRPFWKHALITFGLCLCLFPMFPLIYLCGLATYYCGATTWKNRTTIRKTAFSWIPWKFVGIFFFSVFTGVAVFGCTFGRLDHEQIVREKKDGYITLFAFISSPIWIVICYLPAIRRRNAEKRKSQRQELQRRQNEDRQLLVQRTSAVFQQTKDIENALQTLEVKRRELFRLYLNHKQFLVDRDWPESLFTDFEWHKRDIRDGNIETVFTKLQRLQSSLDRAGWIGRLRVEYKKCKQVIGQDISERAFESLIAGIPETGDFHRACEDVQQIIMQAYEQRAPAWKESESEQHIDDLIDAMDVPEEDAQPNEDIVPLRKRIS